MEGRNRTNICIFYILNASFDTIRFDEYEDGIGLRRNNMKYACATQLDIYLNLHTFLIHHHHSNLKQFRMFIVRILNYSWCVWLDWLLDFRFIETPVMLDCGKLWKPQKIIKYFLLILLLRLHISDNKNKQIKFFSF